MVGLATGQNNANGHLWLWFFNQRPPLFNQTPFLPYFLPTGFYFFFFLAALAWPLKSRQRLTQKAKSPWAV